MKQIVNIVSMSLALVLFLTLGACKAGGGGYGSPTNIFSTAKQVNNHVERQQREADKKAAAEEREVKKTFDFIGNTVAVAGEKDKNLITYLEVWQSKSTGLYQAYLMSQKQGQATPTRGAVQGPWPSGTEPSDVKALLNGTSGKLAKK